MEIDKAYNLWAAQYDSNRNRTRDLDATATRQTLEKFNFSRVIELGCGTGKNTEYLLTKAEDIISIDFSEEMLTVAKQKIRDSRVQFRKADIKKEWELKDDSADLITCSLVLEHIEDMDPVFEQATQKLQQKGLFFVCELHPAKQTAGSKARFETETGVLELTVFVHTISDYLKAAGRSGLELVELEEWCDGTGENEIPRLISFVFKKSSN